MVSKVVMISFVAMLAMANAAKLSSSEDTSLTTSEKESRVLLEIPIIGGIALKAVKVIWFLISKASALIGFKLTALALAASAAVWIFENSFTFILGASVAFGFCKLTGLCNKFEKKAILGLNAYNEQLLYAAKNLDDGLEKYSGSS